MQFSYWFWLKVQNVSKFTIFFSHNCLVLEVLCSFLTWQQSCLFLISQEISFSGSNSNVIDRNLDLKFFSTGLWNCGLFWTNAFLWTRNCLEFSKHVTIRMPQIQATTVFLLYITLSIFKCVSNAIQMSLTET